MRERVLNKASYYQEKWSICIRKDLRFLQKSDYYEVAATRISRTRKDASADREIKAVLFL